MSEWVAWAQETFAQYPEYLDRLLSGDLMSACKCARCGGVLFARDPGGGVEPHPAHAHDPLPGELVARPRCLHQACFLLDWDERHGRDRAG